MLLSIGVFAKWENGHFYPISSQRDRQQCLICTGSERGFKVEMPNKVYLDPKSGGPWSEHMKQVYTF
ncbi:unnamed protein product [Protopolystoma xenopodis]|uniref:Uncharacterized protein n=1 Tax=Protopolystoma xenopodis TaxID=117903 RepID=A0A3S5BVJ0_9PLAT|nr:unnamed protein product [Protopolystoma xenopodis]